MHKIIVILTDKIQINIPKIIGDKYELKFLVSKQVSEILENIQEFKPQLIISDEYIDIKLIKRIVRNFRFIPVAVLGNFEDSKKLDLYLKIQAIPIKLSLSDNELLNKIENLIWSSLAKQDLWEKELELIKLDKKKFFFIFIFRFISIVIFLIISLIFSSKVYNNILLAKKDIFSEVNLPYNLPSDIILLDSSYLICDWSLKNIFEHSIENDQVTNMYIFYEKPNAISNIRLKKDIYTVASSAFLDKIIIFKFPEFSKPVVEISSPQWNNIISIHAEQNNIIILDNNKRVYIYKLEDISRMIFLSSWTFSEMFPVDVYTYNNYFYILNKEKKIVKYDLQSMDKVATIDFSVYFSKDINFVSFAISNTWLYLLSDGDKKIYKISSKILF